MPPNSARDRGNVFLFVLMGVVLFAALAMVISRSMRSQTAITMSRRETALAAAEILDYGQKLARAVDRLRRRGVSESDISFENSFVAGYAHGQPEAHNVFSPAGGGASWREPLPGANDGSDWVFTGNSCVVEAGSGGAGCGSDGQDNEELLAVLINLDQDLCEKIDAALGLPGIPADAGGGASAVKFAGAFAEDTEIDIGGAHQAACFSHGGAYQFYFTLLTR